jgi:hypothetical protein
MRALALLALMSCATPAQTECACSCPLPAPSMPAWPEYGSRLGTGDLIYRGPPTTLLGLPLSCDAGFCVIPMGAL